MTTLTITGHSDDIVSVTGPVNDEYDCYDEPCRFRISNELGAVEIELNYTDRGVWAATIDPVDEDISWPWPIQITPAPNGYSVQADVLHADDVTVARVV